MKKVKNLLFLLKDRQETVEGLEHLLKKDRLGRYTSALRTQTKRKILTGSLFNGYIFQQILDSPIIAQKAFQKPLYPYSGESGLHFSIANSVHSHGLLVSNRPNGVDIEQYRDRNEKVYETFLGRKMQKNMENKEAFYRSWLQKECLVKHGKESKKNEMQYLFFYDYIVGVYLGKGEKIAVEEITLSELIHFYNGGKI